MSGPEHSLRRLDRLWTLLPYAALVAVGVTVLADGNDDTALAIAIAVASALWHYWWIQRHPQWWETALIPMAVYFTGATVLLNVLVALDARFVIVILAWYPMAFVALPGIWAYPAAAVLATGTIPGGLFTFDASAVDAAGYAFSAAGFALVCFLGFMVRSMDNESVRRGRLNTELAQANRELTDLARENKTLQAELVDQARHRGVHDERTRLAGELHDTLAQALAGIVTQLETAEALDDRTAEPVRRRIAVARDLARDNLVELRRSLTALRPDVLEERSLVEALRRTVEAWPHQAAITFTVTGDPVPLTAAAETALLRAVQESLANVSKHADARRVGVTLSFMADVVILDIRDDGRGFDAVPPGLGLTTMRERIERLDGSVQIESAPNAGSSLNLTIPRSAP